jgi:aminoglycoside phosphotransferase (APT) family kinase protein
MATGSVRKPDEVRRGLARWLEDHFRDRGELSLESCDPASSGFSNETIVVDARWSSGAVERLVVRVPALEPTHPETSLAVEAAVQSALADAGLPVPRPVAVETDPAYLGAEFLVMPFVDGRVGPQTSPIDPWLLGLSPDEQRTLVEGFVDFLAGLHGAVLEPGLARRLHGGADLVAEVEWWTRYLDWAVGDDPPPAVVVELLAWCADHAPTDDVPVSLLWGDARLGNAIFGADQRLAAALDWDMTFVGPAEHDLGWFLGLERLTSTLVGRRVPGFPDADALVARYERRLGRRLVALEWFEVFALVRSIAVATRLHHLTSGSGAPAVMPAPDHNPVVPYARELMRALGPG